MNGLLRRIDGWWLRPAPALRPAIVRVLVGLYCAALLAIRGSHYAAVGGLGTDRFVPLGVVQILEAPLPPAVATAAVVATGILCVAFTLGFRYRVVAPAFALSLLWVTSYRNSWGHISHGDNLVVLHVLVLSMTPAADAWALNARGRRSAPAWSPRYAWPLRLMALTTALTYVLAGWAKVRFGGVAWLGGDAVRLQVAFDALRKSRFGVSPSGLTAMLLPHPWSFAPVAVATLALELGAPLALLGRRIAAVWALGMWLLHVGIALVMTLAFAYPLSAVAFSPLFRVERGFARVRRRWARRQRARRTAAHVDVGTV